jgi:hypothetical protein
MTVFWDAAPCSRNISEDGHHTSCRENLKSPSGLEEALFWVVAPCSLVEVCRRFRCSCCLRRQSDDAESTSETSVNFYQTTRRYNPEDSHLRTHRRDNLNSHSLRSCWLQG